MKKYHVVLRSFILASVALIIILNPSYLDHYLPDNDLQSRSLTDYTEPYNSSCPLGLEYFFNDAARPDDALAFSLDNDVPRRVKDAMNSGVFPDRKLILVGDSNFRQVFSSFACITYTEGLWESDDSFTAGMTNVYGHDYNDARLRLKNSLGEIFLAPKAGNINNYDWGEDDTPMGCHEDWIKSCQDLQPFYLDTFSYDSPNEATSFHVNDEKFERVLLGKDDIVIYNGSIHKNSRNDNLKRFSNLLECIDNARAKGLDPPGWPNFFYFRSNQRHIRRNYGDHSIPHCPKKREDDDTFISTEQELFTGRLPLIGFELDLVDLGYLHMSDADCGHWAQPGVPDVYAKNMAEKMMELETKKNKLQNKKKM